MGKFNYGHMSQWCNKTQCKCDVTLSRVRVTIVAVDML